MWTVVYMAQSKEIATALQELLTEDGILVKLRPISKSHDNSDNYYEVLVPEAEVEEALQCHYRKGLLMGRANG